MIVEQRTHLADLTGHVVAQSDWVHLSLLAEFQRHTVFVFPRSGRQVVCEEGDVLWPDREDKPQLEAAKQRRGIYAYNSQWLQSPVPRGGALFREEWLHRSYREPPAHFDKLIISLDTAFKTGESADYSAAVVIGLLAEPDGTHEPGYYVLRAWHDRLPFNELKRFVVALAAEFNPDEVLVEDAASGQSLIQELMADTVLPLKAVKVDSDKFSRASAVTPMFESGRVLFPEVAGWLSPLTSELLAFPAAPHDDLVDALVHGLNHLRHVRDQGSGVDKAGSAPGHQPSDSGTKSQGLPASATTCRGGRTGLSRLSEACADCYGRETHARGPHVLSFRVLRETSGARKTRRIGGER